MPRPTTLTVCLMAASAALVLWQPRTAPPADPLVCSAVAAVGPSGAMPEDLLPTLVSPGDLAVDVGANVGQTAQLLAGASVRARVLSFEPNPATCAAFLTTTAGLQGVDLVCAAVGQVPGLVTFMESPAGSTSFMQLPEGRAARSSGDAAAGQGTAAAASDAAAPTMRTIPVVTLDAVLAARGWPEVKVLKSDTQGREWAALHGATATLAAVPHVVVEFSHGLLAAAGTDQAALVRWLAGRGLACFYMDKRVPGGKAEWPEGMDDCVTPEQLVAAVKGGWTNLWCRRGEEGMGDGAVVDGDNSTSTFTTVLGRRGGAGGET